MARISNAKIADARYPCIPEAMAVANDDEWDDETYARQQELMDIDRAQTSSWKGPMSVDVLLFSGFHVDMHGYAKYAPFETAEEHLEHFYEEVFMELAKFGEALARFQHVSRFKNRWPINRPSCARSLFGFKSSSLRSTSIEAIALQP